MAKRSTGGAVDKYIAARPPETRKALKALRALIRKTAPGVTERISYGIPTFDLQNTYLVYLAGWKNHISMYPVTAAVTRALKEELKPYQTGKGTLQFPLGRPMPVGLIRRIVKLRVAEVKA
jgi:uncharacterized protein YdhG (YjbR/CyaY superfamily)